MQIKRQELIDSLEAVRPGLAGKEILDQSTSFVFSEGRVYSYNDLIAISHPSVKGLAGAVEAKEFHALLTRASDEMIEVETTENELIIQGRRSKAGITLRTEITLPLDAINEDKKTWTPLPEGFTQAVKFALFSAGQDTNRVELTCIHINGKVIESTDNLRITRVHLPGNGLKFSILIPARAAEDLVKYAPTHCTIPVEGASWIHFTNRAGTEFSSRLVNAQFPDTSNVLERKGKFQIKFHEDTEAILDRASVFLSDKTTVPLATINITDGRMTISARGAKGWFKETVRVRFTGKEVAFRIKPEFLKDMLHQLKEAALTDDYKMLKFTGENFIHCCVATLPESKEK